MYAITRDLTAQIYKVAFDGHLLANECDQRCRECTQSLVGTGGDRDRFLKRL